MATVLVFGPTGQIASVAARTAADAGAKVWLAMRDTSKAVPGIDKDTKDNFERVQADLTKPETVQKAAETSGAKRAFLYLAHTSQDHMKGTFEALKKGGVEFVVFLSSFTIHTYEPLKDIAQSEVLPFIHGRAEASLDDVYGEDNYIAIRPGAFASNNLEYADGIKSGTVSLYSGAFEQDCVSPSDIGRVSGTVLASGAKNGQKKVYVYGPQIRTIDDSLVEIGKVLGKDVKVVHDKTEQQLLQSYLDHGLPEFFAKYMLRVHSTAGPDKSGSGERFPRYEEGVKNVELYTGRKSMTLEQWVKENEAAWR